MDELGSFKNDKKYISSREASRMWGVTNDYIARLCRQGKLQAKFENRIWLVESSSVTTFFNARGKMPKTAAPLPPEQLSSREAAALYRVTNDYVARLARQGKIAGSIQNGVWVVERQSLQEFFAHRKQSKLFLPAPHAALGEAKPAFVAEAPHQQQGADVRVASKKQNIFRQKKFFIPATVMALVCVVAFAPLASALMRAGSHELSAAVVSPFFASYPSSDSFTKNLLGTAAARLFSSLGTFFSGKAPEYASTTRVATTTIVLPSSQATSSTQASVPGATKNTIIEHNTYPVIERTVERLVSTSGVTPDFLAIEISKASNALRQEVFSSINSVAPTYAGGGPTNNIALTQRIDKLNGVSISNSSVQGLSGLTDTDIPDTITVSNYVPLTGGTITGDLTVQGGSTFANATSTNFFATLASSTNLYGAGLNTCTSGNVLTWSGGLFGCVADQTSTGAANPFTWANSYGVITAATSSTLWAQQGIFASSTSRFEYASTSVLTAALASTTNLTISSIVSGSLLKTTTAGSVIAAVSGTDYTTPSQISAAFPFTATSYGNSTSTTIGFTQGLLSVGSTTINGNATTTGTLFATTASSTNLFTTSATSSVFAITSVGATLLKTLSSGAVVAAVAGTDYLTTATLPFTYPFPAGATTTQLAFNGGATFAGATSTNSFAVTGSSTISGVLNIGGQLNGNLSAVLASTTLTGNSLFGAATSTTFAITNIASGNLLKTTTSGAIIAAVAGTDYATPSQIPADFTFTSNFASVAAATSSLTLFTNGLSASSTVRFGDAGGTQFVWSSSAGTLSLGSTTPWGRLSVDTSSLAAGVPSFVVGSSSRTDFVITQAGSVGVGTTTPKTTFHTVSNDTSIGGNLLESTSMVFSNGFSLLQLQRDTNTLNTGVGTGFSLYDSASTTQEYGYIGALIESATASAEKGSLIFDTTSSGTARQERMRITAAGNIGIGSTSPWGLLSVNASGLAAGVPQFVVGSSTRTNFVVTQAGRVVIGTSTAINPNTYSFYANDLQINGTSTNSISSGLTFVANGLTTNKYLNMSYHNQILSFKTGDDSGGVAGSPAGFEGVFQIDNANSRVATTYDLNIGAINSTYPFYVEKGASAWAGLILNTFSNATVYFAHGSGYGMHINPSSNASASTYGLQVLDNTAATALYVRGDGKVGIGTSGPLFQFMAQDSVAGSYVGEFYNADTSATSRGIRIRAGSSAGNPGTTNYFILFANGGGTTKGYISGDGAGGVNYTSSSDRRLKENIATTTAGLDTLMKVSVRDFDFISDPEHRKLQGFIAQELNDVYPQAVSPNGDNGTDPLASTSMPWSVDYGRVTPLIVQAVQDLNLKLEDLATTTASSSLPQGSFTTHFFSSLFVRMSMWLADAGNGIADIFATNLHADVVYAKTVHTDELCVGSVCVTEAQFMSAFTSHPNSTQGSGTPAPQDEASSTPPAPEATSTPPVPQEEATSTPPTEEPSVPADESATSTPPADIAPPPAEEPPTETPPPPAEAPQGESAVSSTPPAEN